MSTRPSTGAAAAALAGAVLVAGSLPAAAAGPSPVPTWAPVVELAHGPSLSRPSLAVGPAGAATVVWRSGHSVVASRVDATGHRAGPVLLGHGTRPQVGVDGAGTLTAVWVRHVPGWGPQVMGSRHPVGGAWSRPRGISAPVRSQGSSAHGAFEPDLAVSHDGAVLVSWLSEADDSGGSRAQARYRPAGGAWHRIATLSPVEARSPVCAIGDHGRAVVVYTRFAQAFAVRRSPAGWAPGEPIGRHVEPPQVAMNGAGDTTVAWSALEADRAFRPEAVTRPAGGGWSTPQTLVPPADVQSTWPTVTVGPRGRSTVAWARSSGEVLVSDHPLGGAWSGPTTVAGTGEAVRSGAPWSAVVTGPTGATLVSWTRHNGGAAYVAAAYRPAAGGWQQPHRLSAPGIDAAAAVTAVGAGSSVAAWRGVDASGTAHLQLRRLRP